jgi:recombination protein RecR
MRILPRAVSTLIEHFQKLPGIGPKTAGRLTFYLLHVPQKELDNFSQAVKNLKIFTTTCEVCFNISEQNPCVICANPDRDRSIVCVVEQPIDILSLERTNKFFGLYHVLHGAINPLNNIGPDEIRISELIARIKRGEIKEILLATNSNMEGEATAMYIRREIRNFTESNTKYQNFKITRLAHGLPVGGDVEYADEVTLQKALEGRREY